MKKADIEYHSLGYSGRGTPAVNVKVYKSPTAKDVQAVISEAGEKNSAFSLEWIEENLSDDERNGWFESAQETAWEDLQSQADGIFPFKVKVHSEGRSGGWAYIDGFTADDVVTWNAIQVNRWSRFAKVARQIADNMTFDYVWLIYNNVYVNRTSELDATRRLD